MQEGQSFQDQPTGKVFQVQIMLGDQLHTIVFTGPFTKEGFEGFFNEVMAFLGARGFLEGGGHAPSAGCIRPKNDLARLEEFERVAKIWAAITSQLKNRGAAT